MKKDICFILLFLFVTASSAFAQLIGFESSEVPEAFKTSFIIKRKNGETVWHYLVDI